MLDTVKFKIPVSKSVHQDIFAGKPKASGQKSRRRTCRKIPDPFTGKRFQVRPGNSDNAVVVEMSLARLLQGHNVCGPNNLQRLCFGVAREVYRGLELKKTAIRYRRLKRHDYELLRVDLTGSFDVGSQKNVKAVMNEIRLQLLAQGLEITVHESRRTGIETLYVGKNSKRSTLKFYNKYRELLANPLADNVPGRDQILEYAKGLVRVEYTLRSTELRDMRAARKGLNHAKRWDKNTVRKLLSDRLAKLKFTGEVRSLLDAEEVEGMKPAHRTTYLLWHDGIDLQKYYAPKTYAQSRKKIMEKHGIDIGRPSDHPGTVLSLKELLSPENLRLSWPTRLRRSGAIFGTKEWKKPGR